MGCYPNREVPKGKLSWMKHVVENKRFWDFVCGTFQMTRDSGSCNHTVNITKEHNNRSVIKPFAAGNIFGNSESPLNIFGNSESPLFIWQSCIKLSIPFLLI